MILFYFNLVGAALIQFKTALRWLFEAQSFSIPTSQSVQTLREHDNVLLLNSSHLYITEHLKLQNIRINEGTCGQVKSIENVYSNNIQSQASMSMQRDVAGFA